MVKRRPKTTPDTAGLYRISTGGGGQGLHDGGPVVHEIGPHPSSFPRFPNRRGDVPVTRQILPHGVVQVVGDYQLAVRAADDAGIVDVAVGGSTRGQTLFTGFRSFVTLRCKSRPLRIQFAGAIYHVMARGNGGQRLFHGDDGHQRMLEGLKNTVLDARIKRLLKRPRNLDEVLKW